VNHPQPDTEGLRLTQALAEELHANRDPEAAYAIWHRLLRAAGFCHWAHLAFTDDREPIIRSNYPAVWLQRYVEENYLAIDPVIAEATVAQVPFLWHEATAKIALTKKQRQFFDEAGEFGITLGAGIPTWNPLGRQGLVSVVPELRKASEFERFYRHTRIDLLAASNLLHSHVARLRHQQRFAQVSLTPRERDCLELLREGLPTAQIARRLGLTDRGVQFHVDNLKAKYGVKTRLQLLARFL
jgi:LuxR family transcriptional regulator, activator of conjugal transfer of Ti plasmids